MINTYSFRSIFKKIGFYRLTSICLVWFFSSNLNSQHLNPVRGAAYDVSLIDSITHLSIPVELIKDIKTENLDIEILDIKCDKIPSTVNIAGFENILLKDTLGKTFINIDIFNRPPLQPAVYVLELRIKKKTGADSTVQKTTITITINAAVIKPLSNIAILRKDPFFLVNYKSYGNELTIQESGKKALLSNVKVRTLKIVNAKNELVAATIHFSPIKNIPPGELSTVNFDVRGDLPIGKVTATTEVISPQLAEPVPLTIEITTRRGTYFLLAVIFFGLLFGYLVRIFLEKKIKVNTARLSAIELLQVIATEMENRPDAIFVKKATAIQMELGKALKKTKVEDVNTAVTTAKETLTTAITEHNTRRENVQQMLDSLQAILVSFTSLPPEFNTVAGNSQAELSEAIEKNGSGDTTAAKEILGKILPDLNLRFRNSLKSHRSLLSDGLTALSESNFKLPELKENIDLVQTQLNAIILSPPPEIDQPLLNKLIEINFRAEELLTKAGRLIHKKLSGITETLNAGAIQLPDMSLIEALNKKTDSILKKITASGRSVLDKIKLLPDELNNLQADLRKAMQAQTVLVNEDPALVQENKADKKAIESDVNNGLYTEAAGKIVNFINKNKGTVQEFFEVKMAGIEGLETQNFNDPAFPGPNNNNRGLQLPAFPSTLDAMHEQTLRTIAIAKFWQTLAAGILISVAGYALYADNFMGTPGDIASVFFWAFLLDISVSSLTGGLALKLAKQ